MTVDEDILEGTIIDLQNRLNANSLQRQNLRICLQDIVSIKLIDTPAPTPEDITHTTKELPLDPKLGTTITDERREAIYDKVLVDAENI